MLSTTATDHDPHSSIHHGRYRMDLLVRRTVAIAVAQTARRAHDVDGNARKGWPMLRDETVMAPVLTLRSTPPPRHSYRSGATISTYGSIRCPSCISRIRAV